MNLPSEVVFGQALLAAAGFVLSCLTAVWLRAAWRRRHPSTIRYWGTWLTDPRYLTVAGLMLTAAWILFLFAFGLNPIMIPAAAN